MKTFENPLHKKEFTNKFGETMTMVMSDNMKMWIHHEDCNEDFEKLQSFVSEYILDKDEQDIVKTFIDECTEILNNI